MLDILFLLLQSRPPILLIPLYSTLTAFPPFLKGSPRAGAAEYVLKGDVSFSLQFKIQKNNFGNSTSTGFFTKKILSVAHKKPAP